MHLTKKRFAILTAASVLLSSAISAVIVLGQEAPAISRKVLPKDSPLRRRKEEIVRLEDQATKAWKIDRDYARAESILRRVLEMKGGVSDYTSRCLAELLDEQGRTKEALEYYRQLVHNPLAITEKTPARMLRYAELCDKYNQPHEATRVYTHVLEAIVRNRLRVNVPAHSLNSTQVRAAVLIAMADRQGNFEDLRRLVTRHPGIALGHLLLGLALSERNMLAEADAEFRSAEQLGGIDMRIAVREVRERVLAWQPKPEIKGFQDAPPNHL